MTAIKNGTLLVKDSNGNTVRYYAKSTKYKLALDMLLQ